VVEAAVVVEDSDSLVWRELDIEVSVIVKLVVVTTGTANTVTAQDASKGPVSGDVSSATTVAVPVDEGTNTATAQPAALVVLF
jgi:hypothetical protein